MEQLAIVEVAPRMTYEQFKSIVITMLREYPKLEGKILIAERKAIGARIPFFESLIDELKQQELAQIGQAYVSHHPMPKTETNTEFVHQEKAETLFHGMRGNSQEDEEKIDEIRTIMLGTKPKFWWDIDNPDKMPVVVDGKVQQFQVAKEREIAKAMVKVDELKDKKMLIEAALDTLKSYRPDLETLLREKYIKRKTDVKVSMEMDIPERTFDNRKKEAICEFANLVGLID